MFKGIVFVLLGVIGLFYCVKEIFFLYGIDLAQMMTKVLIWIK